MTQRDLHPGDFKRLFPGLQAEELSDGLYRIKINNTYGKVTADLDPQKIDVNKFLIQLKKREYKSRATTDAPGISGFRQATDASTAFVKNKRRENEALIKFLSEGDYPVLCSLLELFLKN